MSKVPNKVIHINGFFHLPDCFEGRISEDLRLMANYYDSVKGTKK